MNFVLDLFLGRKLKRQTKQYVEQLARLPAESSRKTANASLAQLRARSGPKVTLGETAWGEVTVVPLDEIISGHGLVTGATGAGKTMAILLLVEKLFEAGTSR